MDRGAQELFIGTPMAVAVHTATVMQEVTANTASSDNLLLFLCSNGKTAPLIQVALLANECGANIVAIVPTGSALTCACHRTLNLNFNSSTTTISRFTNRLVCQVIQEFLGEANSEGFSYGSKI